MQRCPSLPIDKLKVYGRAALDEDGSGRGEPVHGRVHQGSQVSGARQQVKVRLPASQPHQHLAIVAGGYSI